MDQPLSYHVRILDCRSPHFARVELAASRSSIIDTPSDRQILAYARATRARQLSTGQFCLTWNSCSLCVYMLGQPLPCCSCAWWCVTACTLINRQYLYFNQNGDRLSSSCVSSRLQHTFYMLIKVFVRTTVTDIECYGNPCLWLSQDTGGLEDYFCLWAIEHLYTNCHGLSWRDLVSRRPSQCP